MLLTLDDPEAKDPHHAGAKAALLARARAAGLPVLPGVVIPAQRATVTLRAGRAALALGGSGRARLAAMQVTVDPGLLDALRRATEPLGAPLIVRSSGVAEGAALWAGAFSTFADIDLEDLSTALRGVWASAFTPHALARANDTGSSPNGIQLAVLVQPQVSPVCSGTARVQPSGIVDVVATTGPTSELLQGWGRGLRARIAADGAVSGPEARRHLGRELLEAVADLARRVHQALGCDLIEWGQVDGRPLLLQVTNAPRPPQPVMQVTPGLDNPLALRVARAAMRAPGPLGETLVLPWALGCERLPEVPTTALSRTPVDDLALALTLTQNLSADVWQRAAPDAAIAAAALLRDLRGPAPGRAFDRLAALRPVAPERAAQILGLIDGMIRAATRQTPLVDGHALWSLEVDEVSRMFRTGAIPPRITPALGPDHWEPFVYGAVAAHGRQVTGEGAAPGSAAGPVFVVTDPHAPTDPVRRPVVVARWPVPALAPLLWSAAALVTSAGSAGAHLIEVASSLGVPAVVQADLAAVGWSLPAAVADRPLLAAVDGTRGTVTITDA